MSERLPAVDQPSVRGAGGLLERAVHVALVVALAAAVAVAALEVEWTGRTVAAGWHRSVHTTQESVMRSFGVDPRVVERVASVIPPTANYGFTLDPRLARSAEGAAFVAFLRASLLPRIEIADDRARWHVNWGSALPSGCCHQLFDAGRSHASQPPVLVFSNG